MQSRAFANNVWESVSVCLLVWRGTLDFCMKWEKSIHDELVLRDFTKDEKLFFSSHPNIVVPSSTESDVCVFRQ